LYRFLIIAVVVKCTSLRMPGHVGRMEETRNAYTILVDELFEKTSLRRPRGVAKITFILSTGK